MKLRSAVAILFAMPVIAFGQTCFEAVTDVSGYIPRIICLESLSETTNADVLALVSTDATLPKTLNVSSVIRHTEERAKFKAEAVMFDIVDGVCGAGFLSSLHISGEINYGQINTQGLTVSIVAESTRDVCHSHPDVETFQYKLVK